MRILLFVVLAQLFAFSAVAGDRLEWLSKLDDPWITKHPPAGDFGIERWTSLPDSLFAFVPESRDEEALSLLVNRDSVAIDCKLATRLASSLKCPRHRNFKPYLVRAVELKQSLGSVGPSQKADEIWMDYLGPLEPGKLRRRAAVLYLRHPPKHLYVTFTLES